MYNREFVKSKKKKKRKEKRKRESFDYRLNGFIN